MNEIKVYETKISFKVEQHLLDSFIEYLQEGKRESAKEDLSWYDEQIKFAENGIPDPQELTRFLLMNPGYFQSDGKHLADWIC